MRISAIGNNRAEAGLTLVEVLVTVTLIALLASVVILTLPPDIDDAETEAFELARQMKGAHDLAVIRGQVIGLDITENAYEFLQYTNGDWQPLALSDSRGSIALPEDVFMSFARSDLVTPGTAGGEQDFFPDSGVEEDARQLEPEIVFRSTGEVTPLEVIIESATAIWRVSQSSGGDVLVQRVDG